MPVRKMLPRARRAKSPLRWRHDRRPHGLDLSAEDQRDARPTYEIEPAFDHSTLGPCSMPLTPAPGNDMHGRYGFYIHGDTASMDQTASEGCIILSRATRDLIDASDDRTLEVVV